MRSGSTIALAVALAVTLLATSTVLAAASASYGLYWSASSAGGGAVDGPSIRLRGSVATAPVGALSGSDYRIHAGYWPGIGRTGPGPTPPNLEGGLFLPLVQRSN